MPQNCYFKERLATVEEKRATSLLCADRGNTKKLSEADTSSDDGTTQSG